MFVQDQNFETTDFMLKTQAVVESARELKAENILALDMRKISSFADSCVITSGRSNRHVRSIATAIIKSVEQQGERPIGVEGLDEGHWVLIDANDVIIHVFSSDSREDFSLERLWSDAPIIELAPSEAVPD